MTLEQKLLELKDIITNMGKVAIGFSGGVDSTLLAKVAYDVLGDKALCITLHEALHSSEEIEESKELAKFIGIKQVIITKNIIEQDFIKSNPYDRCYYCKSSIFSTIKEIAKEHEISYIIDGSNVDDLDDYRPGMKAIKELEVRSPLRESGLTKSEIRQLSKKLGLSTYAKPAFACLASRIPYKDEITVEKLRMVEEAEKFIRSKGLKQIRVRHHGEIARIEIDSIEREKLFNIELLDEIGVKLKDIGFKFVAFEAQGYKMGSLN